MHAITQSILKHKYAFIFVLTILTGLHILWEYLNAGVTTHYPLADDSLPGISNWWGLVSIPLISCLLVTLTQSRLGKEKYTADEALKEKELRSVAYGFIGGLLFGISVSMLWAFRLESVLQYWIYLPILLSLFVSVHRPEHLLGFVLGMTFTFGGVLPIGIGSVLLVISLIVNKGIRGGVLYTASKLK